jgi:hypothetical protein
MDNPGKLVHKKTNKDTAQDVLYTITCVLNHINYIYEFTPGF